MLAAIKIYHDTFMDNVRGYYKQLLVVVMIVVVDCFLLKLGA